MLGMLSVLAEPQRGLIASGQADSDGEGQHTERMRYEEKAKLTAARALIPVAILVASPVLLIAGTPIRRRYLRYVYRDEDH
ncbi:MULTISPECIES: hypothetical protein [unclassified Streptomyces]|uniref:hypothetical protein n=1 Tax=unclassified Streptomyces TaxID=2593676 RepID=UPI0008239AB9|nr:MULTISPECIES: hypothetical protein [unclassified Streptomyces]SCK55569.1 hypothetical protein YW7DRAFT_05141 [Streptomyces sp. AmelKG-E11A]